MDAPERPAEVLQSWKEIASYLNRGVRTVQRWQENGLPVRRVGSGPRPPVIAVREEIDRWMRSAKGQQSLATSETSQALDLASVRNTIARARYLRQQQRLLLETHCSTLQRVVENAAALTDSFIQTVPRSDRRDPATHFGATTDASKMVVLDTSSFEDVEMSRPPDSQPETYVCAICKQPLQLETAKTDGDGHAVHDHCYTELLKEAAHQPSNNAA